MAGSSKKPGSPAAAVIASQAGNGSGIGSAPRHFVSLFDLAAAEAGELLDRTLRLEARRAQ